VPTNEPDLLHYLCGRTIAQTNAEKAHQSLAGQSGFGACIARRAHNSDPELNGNKVIAAYYAAKGGSDIVQEALKQVSLYYAMLIRQA